MAPQPTHFYFLGNQRSAKRIALIWDGASYHRSDEVKKFLAPVNDRASSSSEWQITYIRFAPNPPEQNPVEDVWLQTKNFPLKILDSMHIFFCCQVAV